MKLLNDCQQTSKTNWPNKATNARAYRSQNNALMAADALCDQNSYIDCLERQMVEAADQHLTDLRELQRFFIFQDVIAVTSFLHDHRAVSQVLLQAVPFLNKYFGTDNTVSLCIDCDESGSRILYGIVPWRGTARAARLALNNFDDNWWMAHARQASGRLTFTYELM